jgi:hypothetical protein
MFIAITLVAALLAYGLYHLDLLDRQGAVVLNRNFEVDIEDPMDFGKEFNRRIAALPDHVPSPSPLFPDSTCPVAFRMNQGGKVIERFYYKVRLSDGSFTDVGFLVFKLDTPGRSPTGFSTVLFATDSFFDRSAGTHLKRYQERHRLEETYAKLQFQVRSDYLAAHKKNIHQD